MSKSSVWREISKIKERNARVEADKAWETSWTRTIIIAVLTYIVIVLFFYSAGFQKYWANALVPTIGFLLSTLSVSFVKWLWVRK